MLDVNLVLRALDGLAATPDETQLIRQVVAGNADAFARLYDALYLPTLSSSWNKREIDKVFATLGY